MEGCPGGHVGTIKDTLGGHVGIWGGDSREHRGGTHEGDSWGLSGSYGVDMGGGHMGGACWEHIGGNWGHGGGT